MSPSLKCQSVMKTRLGEKQTGIKGEMTVVRRLLYSLSNLYQFFISFLVNFSFMLSIPPRLSVLLHPHLVTLTSVSCTRHSLTCGLFCPFPRVYKLRVLSDCVTFVDVSLCISNLVCPQLFGFKLLFKLQPVSELIPKPFI